MHALENVAPSDLMSSLVREHAIAHLDADLRWLAAAAEQLSAGADDPARTAIRADLTLGSSS
jgi:hypothetical protein